MGHRCRFLPLPLGVWPGLGNAELRRLILRVLAVFSVLGISEGGEMPFWFARIEVTAKSTVSGAVVRVRLLSLSVIGWIPAASHSFSQSFVRNITPYSVPYGRFPYESFLLPCPLHDAHSSLFFYQLDSSLARRQPHIASICCLPKICKQELSDYRETVSPHFFVPLAKLSTDSSCRCSVFLLRDISESIILKAYGSRSTRQIAVLEEA